MVGARAPLVVGALVAVLALAGSADARSRTVTLRYGPVRLAGFQVKRDTATPRTPRVNGFITAMRAHVVDRKGNDVPITRVMLHHLLFQNLGRFRGDRHDAACPDIPRERFFGRGEEGLSLDLPAGYGYRVRKRDVWHMNWMLMNHTRFRQVAYIEYKVTVSDDPHLRPVRAFWLDVARCHGGSIFNVPGGRQGGARYHKSLRWRVPFSGRIVEAGSHLHGGSLDMTLRQPACRNRTLLRSYSLYGMPDNPVYMVRPVLHEPGPISTSIFRSQSGIRVKRGDRLIAGTTYENNWPHPAAMAMLHVYMARAKASRQRCAPLPGDATNATAPGAVGHLDPPHVTVPLTAFNGRRYWTVSRPPGRIHRLRHGTTVTVRGFGFHPPNLSVPLGATLRWRFPDPVLHNVTLANGPIGFASLHLWRGARYRHRFTRPGTYRLFCSLHPTSMHEVVTVRRRR